MGKEYEERMLQMQKALLAVQLNPALSKASMIDKVRILKNAGLDYKDIAEILGTTPNSISVMFAKINKEKR